MSLSKIVVASAAVAALALPAQAALISYENFNYSGTVTSYASLSDAQNGTGGTAHQIATATNGSNSTLPNARDGAVYFDTEDPFFSFMTAWYFTPQEHIGKADGFGNPNNRNPGFIQIYDDGMTSVTSYTVSNDGMTITLDVEGAALSSNYPRLWEAPDNAAGSGTFLDYDLSMAFTFGDGMGDLPTGVTGKLSALFAANSGGFYVADFDLSNGSAARAGNYVVQGYGDSYDESAYNVFDVAQQEVPAPAALGLFGLGIAAMGARRRKAR